jgi:hypothetical protein
MTVNEALILMNEKADTAEESLKNLGITVTRETRFMNSVFRERESAKGAKYASVTLYLSGEGISEEDTLCLSVTAEIKRGTVDAEKVKASFTEFDKYVSGIEEKINNGQAPTDTVLEYSKAANEEYQELLGRLNEMKAKQQKVSAIGTVVFIIGIFILFAVALWI